MPVIWTFPQLMMILFVGFFFLSLTFSRRKPMAEATVLFAAAHYLVINNICWIHFLLSTIWEGGEEVFRFGVTLVLPAVSFYFGCLTAVSVLWACVSSWRRVRQFSVRQRWFFLASSVVFLVGIIISTRAPVAVQAWVDSIDEEVKR